MENSNQIEKTLSSLDDLQKAEMHPFLYEKIKHRMQAGKSKPVIGVVFSWKLVAACILVISINILACLNYKTEAAVQNTNTSTANTTTENYYYNTSYNY